jgi:hypothetical protein
MEILGSFIGGSDTAGLQVRLHSDTLSPLAVGEFLVLQSASNRLICLVVDVQSKLVATELESIVLTGNEQSFRQLLSRHGACSTALVKPLLTITADKHLHPKRTLPPLFTPARHAVDEEIQTIFGSDKPTNTNLSLGIARGMQAQVCVDTRLISQRSSGVFGKTGTGKTFITRLLVAGLLAKKSATVLVFDMHSEYGHQARTEGGGFVKGLKHLFGGRVVIASLDPQATRKRGASADLELRISYQTITPDDILGMNEELSLHQTACEAAYLLYTQYQERWLLKLFEQAKHLKELAQEIGAHTESLSALYRKLRALERLPFLTHETSDSIESIGELLQRGTSVIIEFGRQTSTLAYLLVANLLTRRIHAQYKENTESFLATGAAGDEPKQLVIVIEEAHKFLSPSVARQTIFGIIAREMRKYYVSLMVVDQRPSEISPEIISQIGTKIILQLSDEADVNAALAGSGEQATLRSIVASLSSKKQALITGHAVALPIAIHTRSYDEAFYTSIQKEAVDLSSLF